MKLKFEMTGMTCASCSARVKKVTRGVSGVTDAQVDLQAKTVTATGGANRDALCKAITDAGYEVVG